MEVVENKGQNAVLGGKNLEVTNWIQNPMTQTKMESTQRTESWIHASDPFTVHNSSSKILKFEGKHC